MREAEILLLIKQHIYTKNISSQWRIQITNKLKKNWGARILEEEANNNNQGARYTLGVYILYENPLVIPVGGN